MYSNRLRGSPWADYDSIMCSTPEQRIAAIGEAIDSLAADAATAYRAPDTRAAGARPADGEASDADQVVMRLARLWEQLAELDPEVAKRKQAYEA